MIRSSIRLLLVMTPLSCSDPVSIGNLVHSFTVLPSPAAAGDSLRAVLTVRNPSGDTVQLVSAAGCMTFLRAYRGIQAAAVDGANYGCTGGARLILIPPLDSAVEIHALVAADGRQALIAGTYTVRTQLNIPLSNLEANFAIRE